MDRRTLLAVTGWLATTVAATLVGLAAVDLVGAGITGTAGGVRTERDVARALAVPDPGVPSPTGANPAATTAGPRSGAPAATGARRDFVTPGGSVLAECVPGGVRVVTWSPAPGYRTKDAEAGPDDHVEVRFVGGGQEYELRLRCRGQVPTRDSDD
ncbi:septum formation initiator [Micromonospora sp. WMMD1128]|uniref:septum formation initiator n=1 Tax=unclassified Micromonospora TaxID=2617518 RepID=UPI00248BD2BB|nr:MULTISPECIES: septum formation initiator [unclassified Micromonospora]WBB72537.1 septum formation initiator [Micromonospora sp. WMMD1128]WFE34003.1 septum formation initiator [Micromonospora sp. WMMD975]